MRELKMTETNMQGGIIQAAELHGWDVYHVANVGRNKQKIKCPSCGHNFIRETKGRLRSKSGEGYMDLTLVHGQRAMFMFAELKDDERDKTLPIHQRRWRQTITEAARYGAQAAHAVWRPKHYDDVLNYLGDRNAEVPNQSVWLPTG